MLEQTTTVPDSKSVLTIVEIARLLRYSKAHVCNLMAGKVRGALNSRTFAWDAEGSAPLHGSANG